MLTNIFQMGWNHQPEKFELFVAWNLAPMKDFVDKNKETNEAAQATLGDLYDSCDWELLKITGSVCEVFLFLLTPVFSTYNILQYLTVFCGCCSSFLSRVMLTIWSSEAIGFIIILLKSFLHLYEIYLFGQVQCVSEF